MLHGHIEVVKLKTVPSMKLFPTVTIQEYFVTGKLLFR